MPRPPRTIRLCIEYDGTNYAGWQRQKNRPTVQGTLERALERMLGTAVAVHGAGRTDAGVHALGQTAHFMTRAPYEPHVFRNALNALLPPDIVVREAAWAPPGFHARFSAVSKEYEYWIWNHPVRSPLLRRRTWHVRHPLNLEAMRNCLKTVEGTHDFSAFRSAGSGNRNPVRTIQRCGLTRDADGVIRIRVCADGFLRHMVRNLVGTWVQVGTGKRTPREFEGILRAGDRASAGPKAPPQGLVLVKVYYDPPFPG